MLHQKIPTQRLVKTAAKTYLSDNPAQHPSELLAALYKQHTFLGRYQVNLEVKGQDDRQGYMYGVFVVAPPVEVPPPTGSEVPPPAPDPASVVRIPVIVAARKAFPFDVMISPEGKFAPLSEERVAAVMFSSSPYLVAPAPQETGAADMGGDSFDPNNPPQSGRMAKTGSVLTAIPPSEEAATGLLERIVADPALLHAIRSNEGFSSAVNAMTVAARSTEKTASVRQPATAVVVLEKRGSHYVGVPMSAQAEPLAEVKLARADIGALTLDVRQRLVDDGYAVLADKSTTGLSVVPNTPAKPITKTGAYAVMTQGGTAARAAVIANPISLSTGMASEGLLVVSPLGAAVQDKVAGVLCGELSLGALRGSSPAGQGVFVFGDACTEVVKVAHVVTVNGRQSYILEDALLGNVVLHVGGVAKLAAAGAREFIIPSAHAFVPVKMTGVKFGEDPERMVKLSSRVAYMNEVSLSEDTHGKLSFSGAGLDKTASYSDAQALGVLALLGDSDMQAKKKIAAAHSGAVSFVAERRIPRAAKMEKVASADLERYAATVAVVIRADLVKEASELTQRDTVDAVLSLGFITPENVQNYVDALPVFEETVSKLAELLVGVRLGLSDVQEGSVSPALTGLERAVVGLKKLQLRAGAETA